MGSQSTAKTIFLLTSMVGWLLIGGALIYSGPLLYHLWAHSEQTTLWMTNLEKGGYNPIPSLIVSAIILPLEIGGYWLWYSRYDQQNANSSIKKQQ